MISRLLWTAALLFIGHHWHGERRSNAGWFRPGDDRAGPHEPTRWERMPRARRASYRLLGLGAAVLVTAGLVVNPVALANAAVGLFWFVTGSGLYGFRRWCRKSGHYSDRYVLMHRKMCALVGWSKHKHPRSWLSIPMDFAENPDSAVTLTLPDELRRTDGLDRKIENNVKAVLGNDHLSFEWPKGGERPQVLAVRTLLLPPGLVTFADIREDLRGREPGTIILGKIEGNAPGVIKPDGPNPHTVLSASTGRGKSAAASTMRMQSYHDGAIGLILDVKLVSIPWARQLECVRYMSTIPDIHDALCWVLEELQRRFEAMERTVDMHGNVDASVVGPPLWIDLEEANSLVPELVEYYADIREQGMPKRSPAIKAIRWAVQQGRQAGVHMNAIAQYLTVSAIGGTEARQNFNTRILLGPDPKTWNLLAGPQYKVKGKWPETVQAPGAAWVLDNGQLWRCQVAYTQPPEALAYVREGTVTPFPESFDEFVSDRVPGRVPPEPPANVVHIGLGRRDSAADEPEAPRYMSLPEACRRGIVAVRYDAARKRRIRARKKADELGVPSDFPVVRATDGDEELYDPAELANWFGANVTTIAEPHDEEIPSDA